MVTDHIPSAGWPQLEADWDSALDGVSGYQEVKTLDVNQECSVMPKKVLLIWHLKGKRAKTAIKKKKKMQHLQGHKNYILCCFVMTKKHKNR